MNGAADLGGMMGFGPVEPEPEDERFHADWERRAFALTLAMAAARRWSIDTARSVRESLPPGEYLTSSYYAIWTKGLERLLADTGLLGADGGVTPWSPDDARAAFAAGSPYDRSVTVPARFGVGDAVRTKVMHPAGHTRLPRYARGKAGVVERVHGVHVLPDANAHGRGEQPQWLYAVRFAGTELWGPDADPGLTVAIDAWESYLEPAQAPP